MIFSLSSLSSDHRVLSFPFCQCALWGDSIGFLQHKSKEYPGPNSYSYFISSFHRALGLNRLLTPYLALLTLFTHLWYFPSPDLSVGQRIQHSSPAPLLLLKVLQEPGHFKDSYCNLKEIWNGKSNKYKDATNRILIIMIPNVVFYSVAEMSLASPCWTFEFYFTLKSSYL